MADEIEIVNFGDGGVASEATLKALLSAVENMDGGKSKAAKIQQLHNRAVESGIKVSTKNRDALTDHTESVNTSTKAVSRFSDKLKGTVFGALGALGNSLTGFTNHLISGETSLSGFVSNVPLIGSYLSGFAGLFDESMDAFRTTSSVGASFNNDITQMRVAAADARLSLAEYTSFVTRNSETLAKFGGTVTQGALRVNNLNKAMGKERENLLNMGLTYEEINEGLVTYMNLQRAGSRVDRRTAQEQAASAANYIKQIDKLAKLTGEDAASLAQKTAAQSADIAFQMKLARLRPEEREKVMAGLTEALAMGGETGAEYFKQQFLGMPPLTDATRTFAAALPESANLIGQLATSAQDASISVEKFNSGSVDRMADFVEAASKEAGGLEGLLQAAAAGLDGPASDIAGILEGMGKQFTDYQDTQGNFQRDKLIADLQLAANEQDSRAAATAAVVEYEEGMKELRQTLIANVLNPLMNTFAPLLEEFMREFGEFAKSDDFKDAIDKVKEVIMSLKTSITNFIGDFKNAENPIEFLKEKIKEKAAGAMAAIGTAIKDAIISGLTSIWENGGLLTKVGLAIGGLFAAGSVVSSLTTGIRGLFGGGGGDSGNERRSSRKGGGGSKMGKALEGLTGGLLKGIATGLIAFANPLVPLGAAAVGAAIVAIGAGVAGAAWLMGEALPNFAAGMKSFEDLNGEKLAAVGDGVTSLGIGLVAFGAGNVASAIGGITDMFAGFLGADSPADKIADMADKLKGVDSGIFATFGTDIEKFNVNLDADKISNYAESIEKLAEAFEELNEQLAEKNNGFGESGVSVASTLGGSGFGSSGTSEEKINQLNNTIIKREYYVYNSITNTK
mgnify:CR=1 FL=1